MVNVHLFGVSSYLLKSSMHRPVAEVPKLVICRGFCRDRISITHKIEQSSSKAKA